MRGQRLTDAEGAADGGSVVFTDVVLTESAVDVAEGPHVCLEIHVADSKLERKVCLLKEVLTSSGVNRSPRLASRC